MCVGQVLTGCPYNHSKPGITNIVGRSQWDHGDYSIINILNSIVKIQKFLREGYVRR